MSSKRVACGLFAACIAALFVAPGEANAETKYRISITSTPSGAKVYVDSRETAAVGTTPLNYAIPAGNHTLILELEDHEQLVDSIYVKKQRWRRQRFKMKLVEIQYGFVAITAANGAAEGASILVDGEKAGIVPRTIKMSPGAHQVEIVRKGYERFEKWLEIKADKKTALPITLKSEGGDEPPETPEPKAKVRKKTSTAVPTDTALLTATAAVEFAWRKLRYRNAQTPNLRPFDADHVGMLNVHGRLHPLAHDSNVHLRRLAFTGAISLAVPVETSTDDGTENIKTSWREFDFGIGYTMEVNDDVALSVDLAYGATQFTFDNAGMLMDSVPEVDYRYVRLAGELVYRDDKLRVAAGGAWLPIRSTGVMADRFDRVASAGLKVHAGVSRAITKNLAAEFSTFYRRYAHNFGYNAGDTFQADGAQDHFFGVTLGLTLRAY